MSSHNGKHKIVAVSRPYTAYNVFFQLEREYILQNVFQVVPCLQLSDIFDYDPKEYHGPRLPSRYSEIILRREWHLPGKGRRNKRSHRASHGKIGFKELSQLIAKSWTTVDAETKEFCQTYSEECRVRYKSIIADNSSDIVVEIVISNPEISMLVKDRGSRTSGRAPPPGQQANAISKACQVSDDLESNEIISNPEVITHFDNETPTALEIQDDPEIKDTPEALNSIIIDTLF
eukprot:CCRYP_018677-RA/>CCRYP_018677-RA protein AED:0.32 eAED:0.32 QI:1/1/1/1/1/0.5/2/0/232